MCGGINPHLRERDMAAKIFIDGEAGTTGLQIRDRLAGRRDIELLSIDADKRKDNDERKRLLNAADIAILCLPDEAARESVALIDNDTTRVIDASSAHRVAEGWTYGFAEMDRAQSQKIAAASVVANPGCWPQGVIAMVRPLVEAGLLPAELPAQRQRHFRLFRRRQGDDRRLQAAGSSANEFMPYGLTFKHKHLPEMQTYSRLAHAPLFTPAVGNFAQGMVTLVPLQLWTLEKVPSGAALHAAIADHFAGLSGGFVEVAPFLSEERSAALDPELYNNTNRMVLQVFVNDATGQAVLAAAYDNLGKGASGAAVQNLNLMLGVAEDTSLAA